VVGDQTIDWFAGKHYVAKGYENYYRGAWQLLKDLGYDAAPFLDWMMRPDLLAKYELVWVANAACLSDAQCDMLREYAAKGGTLIVTHLSGIADEYGKMRGTSALSELTGAVPLDVEPVEIPDLYLKLPNGDEIPQDPQVLRFRAAEGAEVLATTIDRGHRANLGPAIVRKGRVIYIGSGLEAVYNEARLKVLRTYLRTLIDPVLGPHRRYEVEAPTGLLPQLTASKDTLLLHLIADTGNKTKKLRIREEFQALENVKLRIRIPEGRTVRSASLLRARTRLNVTPRAGWIEMTLPRVLVHEAIRVDLA
jgi:hypothetical protein